METENYNEPWHVTEDALLDCNGEAIRHIDTRREQRILACVNACKGMRTESLQRHELQHLVWVTTQTRFALRAIADELEEDGGSKKMVALLRELDSNLEGAGYRLYGITPKI